ncbi:MAG TPA: alpha-L-fucosidase [Candidatus Dormibacteraeota bacterium]|nr:alpha-L-fucosidase [Candidatus Dormibacteraeota bacterium]
MIDARWWTEARFGLFIHWGIYAVAGRHEWVKERERLSDERYQRYFTHFFPDLFDPAAWAREARLAGMRYFVVTTKHHDGFCLWDSDLTDYKVTNTPWGRDLLGPMVEAFRAEGLRVGFYHSLLDWHHPEFPVDGLHPQGDDPDFVAAAAGRDIGRYADYLHGQVHELLTRYGSIDYLFFDFSYADRFWGGKGAADWRSEELLAMVRSLQPGALVNDRLGIPGDFVTPEQYQPAAPVEREGRRVLWEACQTLNGSWGYDRDNRDFKTPAQVVRMLVDGVSKDGNLLLNVGPTGRGQFDSEAVRILREIGEWMSMHERSIRGCGASGVGFTPPTDCRYTQSASGDRLYVHFFAWPFRHAHLPGLASRVEYAQFLHDASEVQMTTSVDSDTLTLHLPTIAPPVHVPVVELFLRT